MSEDRLTELLREADAESGAPAALPHDLAARVLRLHQQRARTAARVRNIAAVLVVVVSASVMFIALDRFERRPKGAGQAVPVEAAGHWKAELDRLQTEADLRVRVARRLADIEQQQKRIAELQADLREPDPRQVVRQEVDLTATVLVQQADHMYRDLGLPRPAAENYREVARLFPDTAPAAVARQRLKEMETAKGES